MSDDPLFHRPDGRPLPEDHHLTKNPRGKYVIRAVVGRTSKFVGKRITVQTGTSNLGIARRIRDKTVMEWIKKGSLVREIVLSDDSCAQV